MGDCLQDEEELFNPYTAYTDEFFQSLILHRICILTNTVCEQDKLLQIVITRRHIFREFCRGFDLVRKSSLAIGDTLRALFITEGRFCTYNHKSMRESSLNENLNKNILTPPHCAWNIAWISTQWGILYSFLALHLSKT